MVLRGLGGVEARSRVVGGLTAEGGYGWLAGVFIWGGEESALHSGIEGRRGNSAPGRRVVRARVEHTLDLPAHAAS
jgi:hypothetical protein